jgi:hypothetical protein
VAGQHGSTAFTDYRAMIEKTKPEFVVALDTMRPCRRFRFLVETGFRS